MNSNLSEEPHHVQMDQVVKTQLDYIQKRFNGFNAKLQADRGKKIDEHESSFRKIRAGIEHLEEQVRILTVDRVKTLKDMQKLRLGGLNNLGEETLAHGGDEYVKMHAILEKTKARLKQLEEKHIQNWENVWKQQQDGMNQIKQALEDFRQYYKQVCFDNSKIGDEIVNTLREKDIKYNEAFKEENAKNESMVIQKKKKVEEAGAERQKMTEEIRRTMEESLLEQVRRIKAEDTIRKQQRDEFLRNIEHFTKRIQHTIKEM